MSLCQCHTWIVLANSELNEETRLVVNRDKPRNFGLWFMVLGLLLIIFYCVTLCSSSHSPPGLWTLSWHSEVLGASITQTLLKLWGGGVGWVAHKILEAPQIIGILWDSNFGLELVNTYFKSFTRFETTFIGSASSDPVLLSLRTDSS